MIDIANGRAVEKLIDRAIARPDRFSDIALCAPFIDEGLLPRLAQLAVSARRAKCGFRVVTSHTAARTLLARLPGPPAFWRPSIVVNDRVHAKAYLATPRGRGVAEAIVTSANLTTGGVFGNIELGVVATTASFQGRRVVHAVRDFIKRVSA